MFIHCNKVQLSCFFFLQSLNNRNKQQTTYKFKFEIYLWIEWDEFVIVVYCYIYTFVCLFYMNVDDDQSN